MWSSCPHRHRRRYEEEDTRNAEPGGETSHPRRARGRARPVFTHPANRPGSSPGPRIDWVS
jgi:hypothetical protein